MKDELFSIKKLRVACDLMASIVLQRKFSEIKTSVCNYALPYDDVFGQSNVPRQAIIKTLTEVFDIESSKAGGVVKRFFENFLTCKIQRIARQNGVELTKNEIHPDFTFKNKFVPRGAIAFSDNLRKRFVQSLQ